MKNRKTRTGLRRMLLTLALVLVVAAASVGGTIAWLTDQTQEVKNTFTVGDVDITLTETGTTKDASGNDSKTFHIIPGTNYEKDPTVTVEGGSEACWVFVKVEEANWPNITEDDETTLKIRYEVNEAVWTKLETEEGGATVYYREVSSSSADQSFNVLKTLAGQTEIQPKAYTVIVSENLTKEEAESITPNPTLTFTAYAIQKDNIATAGDAWAKLNAGT